ncbi:MAG: DUF1573 domain-containing protein [Candidatus Daviesbacteria bacterium]|nr:DUF1573 domain-containing protein [Candidatus Daviesbacteria bacterium]
MNNDKKILIGFVIITLAILGGAIFFLSQGPSSSKAVIQKTVGAKIETPETSFDFKDIPYSGGNAVHEYKIKNTGDKDLEIANMNTSCACSKTYFKSQKGESPKFSMKGMSAPSSWKGILSPGEEGSVIFSFDPTYHGPTAIGPISRIVSFETNDPDHPYVEFSFTGNVLKN